MTTFIFSHHLCADNKNQNGKPIYTVVGGQGLTPFPNNENTRRIIKRTDLIREGNKLAHSALYDQAIIKFQEAMDPSLFNDPRDEAEGRYGIMKARIRQSRFKDALNENQWFIQKFGLNESNKETRQEILALIDFQTTGTAKFIYNHVESLKNKYSDQLPPRNFVGNGPIVSSEIIHLYDYINDSDKAIAFLNEFLTYLKKRSNASNSDKSEIAEYEAAKQAFKEDKQTGLKGHLQKVIATSEYIGW